MTHKEKLDLVLKGLYQYRFDGNYYSIFKILSDQNLSYNYEESRSLAERLKKDGYVKLISTKDSTDVKITSEGVEYCEQDSYSNSEKPIIQLINYNSPNSNIILGNENSQKISLNQDTLKVLKEIQNLKDEIHVLRNVDKTVVTEIGVCLDEIAEKLHSGKKVSSGFFQGILSISADLITIHPKINDLYEKVISL